MTLNRTNKCLLGKCYYYITTKIVNKGLLGLTTISRLD